jgi:hypothetical protein
MRGIFMLPEESRLILQNFLTEMPSDTITVSIDPKGRCILARGMDEQREKPAKGVAS